MPFWIFASHDRDQWLRMESEECKSASEAQSRLDSLTKNSPQTPGVSFTMIEAKTREEAWRKARNQLSRDTQKTGLPDTWSEPEIRTNKVAFIAGVMIIGLPAVTVINYVASSEPGARPFVASFITAIVFSVTSVFSKKMGYVLLGIAQMIVGSEIAGIHYGLPNTLDFWKFVFVTSLASTVMAVAGSIGLWGAESSDEEARTDQ